MVTPDARAFDGMAAVLRAPASRDHNGMVVPLQSAVCIVPRPREFDHGTVVDAAMHAFWSGGLVATSVDDLLRSTGLSRSSMYQCIGNRDTLIELAVGRYVDQLIAAIDRLFAAMPFPRALETLLTDAALDNFGGRGCLLANGLTELHAAEAAGIKVVRTGMSRLCEALGRVIASGCPRCTDPAQRCVEVMVAIVGLRTLQRAGTRQTLLRGAARRFASELTRD